VVSIVFFFLWVLILAFGRKYPIYIVYGSPGQGPHFFLREHGSLFRALKASSQGGLFAHICGLHVAFSPCETASSVFGWSYLMSDQSSAQGPGLGLV